MFVNAYFLLVLGCIVGALFRQALVVYACRIARTQALSIHLLSMKLEKGSSVHVYAVNKAVSHLPAYFGQQIADGMGELTLRWISTVGDGEKNRIASISNSYLPVYGILLWARRPYSPFRFLGMIRGLALLRERSPEGVIHRMDEMKPYFERFIAPLNPPVLA